MIYINNKLKITKVIFYFISFLCISSSLSGATRGDVKVIESSENIRYLSQKLVNDYLFFYQYPKNYHLKSKLKETIEQLNEHFKIIARITKNSDTKDILDFLAYSKDNIIEIIQEKSTLENCALMLDYSEILIEGVNSIESVHIYAFSKEEKMLMLTKKMEYLLQRVSKHYMAIHLHIDPMTNKQAMNQAMRAFELNLIEINRYNYSQAQYRKVLKKLNQYWGKNRLLFKKTEELFVPNLILLSLNTIEDIVFKMTFFHSKNQ